MSAIQHIAFLRFKPGTSEEKLKEIFACLGKLPEVIPGIVSFSAGKNTSRQGLDQGYTHAFTMVFENNAARERYLPHPEHQKFEAITLPHLAGLAVIDYDLE